MRRQAVTRLVAITIGLVVAAAAQAPARAATEGRDTQRGAVAGAYFGVLNAPNPVNYRKHPNWSYPDSDTFRNGDVLWLGCYFIGAPAGPNNNPLWYHANNTWDGGLGFVNDRYLNTPGTATSPQPQAEPCMPAGEGRIYADSAVYTAVNAPSTVLFGNHPSKMWSAGHGFINGDTMELTCHFFGAPAGPYNNTLWYMAYDRQRSTHGWINDHNLNTPGTAANPQPQTPACWDTV